MTDHVIETIIETIKEWVSGPVLIVLCLFAGLYFSFGTGFVQVRRFGEMARLLFSTDKKQKTGITSFQAFAMALSGRVGTGNIVGVASAIGFGGPGAIVWMWIIAFLGSGTAFAEATLAQVFKENHKGEFRGGPTYYIEKGLRAKWLAVVFAVCAVVACGILLPPVQVNGFVGSFASTLGVKPVWIGIVTVVLVGVVIIGGVKRIANVAQIVAPFMAILYILISIVILVIHAKDVPEVFGTMIRSAFGVDAVFGAIIGSALKWGVRRGLFSNEAGQGTGPIAAAAAKVSHPVKQGLVQAFSVYVDTLLVCTATAVMILACNTYNVHHDSVNSVERTQIYTSSVESVAQLEEPTVDYTTAAVSTLLGEKAGGIVISVALLFFAFTTIMTYYYYAETNLVYLFGKGRKEKVLIWVLRGLLIVSAFFGSIRKASLIWAVGDIGVAIMTLINIVAILLLSRIPFRALWSYEKQKKAGKEPEFNPEELNIKNTDYWKK